MRHEAKRDHAPAQGHAGGKFDGAFSLSAFDASGSEEGSATGFEGGFAAGRAAHGSMDRAPSERERWFPALDPHAATPPPPQRPSARRALPLIIAALIALVATPGMLLRALLSVGLGAAALVIVARSRRALPTPPEGPRRGLSLEGERVSFRGDARVDLVLSTSAAFGVTLLATPRRDRLLAVVSSALGTFSIGASFNAADRRALLPLLERATAVGGDDGGFDAIGPDGAPLQLSPDALAALLDALVELSPACLDRFVLTDARGQNLTLDGRALSIGERAFDLGAPLEWRSIVFQEAFGQAVAVYQGTWIRQNGSEVVFICLLPSLGAAVLDADVGSLDRAALRDLRLMQACPESPPPSDQRIAIERPFMLPLRSALDRAPRAPGLMKKSASP
jgi:hypothetical protein